jgi:hypothetical protein
MESSSSRCGKPKDFRIEKISIIGVVRAIKKREIIPPKVLESRSNASLIPSMVKVRLNPNKVISNIEVSPCTKMIAKVLINANVSGITKSLTNIRQGISAITKIIRLIVIATSIGVIGVVENAQTRMQDKPNSSLSLGFTSLIALLWA